MPENFILYFIAGFILLDVLIFFYVLRHRKSRKNKFNHDFYQTHWGALQNTFKFSPNQALMEADKLFDHAMKDLGYTGTFVDKFKKAQTLIFNSQQIWNAHKLRNRIAHEAGFQPQKEQVQFALNSFRRGLMDLGVNL